MSHGLHGPALPLMKSAYELAMERLSKQTPSVVLSDDQKRRLAELDAVYRAKLAEKELAAQAEMAKALEAGQMENAQEAEQRWFKERRTLQAEWEESKDRIRNEAG